MQWRSAAKSAKSPSHQGGSSSFAARLSAWFRARAGCFCQQRPHSSPSCLGASLPHAEHGRGAEGLGPGFEHGPHQPVPARMKPGRPQRGQGRLASAASFRRRHARQRTASLNRTTRPQSTQVREQVVQRPVSGERRRNLPQPGQSPRREASRSAARQRWHRDVPARPIPPPHRSQSPSLTVVASTGPGRPWGRPSSASASWPGRPERCRHRTGRLGCSRAPCTTRPGWRASPGPAAW